MLVVRSCVIVMAFLIGLSKQLLAEGTSVLASVGQIQALGSCAPYFKAGKQIKKLPRNLRCSFEVSFGRLTDCPTCPTIFDLQGDNVQLRGRYVNKNKLSLLHPLLESEGRLLKVAPLQQNNGAVLTLNLKKQSRFLQLGAFTFKFETLNPDDYCNSLNEIAQEKLDQLQSCSSDNDCGKALFPFLENSGVGPVVRADATREPLLNFYEEMRQSGCYPPDIFILPIFQIDGYVCESGRCNWQYAEF